MIDSISPEEVRRLVTEELNRLCELYGIREPLEQPIVKSVAPAFAKILYKRTVGRKRLAAPLRHGTMTAYERAKIVADIFSIMRSYPLK